MNNVLTYTCLKWLKVNVKKLLKQFARYNRCKAVKVKHMNNSDWKYIAERNELFKLISKNHG